jgi:energy-coupling factor transport system permease protein
MRSAYVSNSRMLSTLHPLTKTVMVVLLILAAYLIPWLWWPITLFALIVVLAFASGVGRSFLRTIVLGMLPIVISVFLIQGLLFPPPNATPFTFGPLTLTYEGLALAFGVSTRLLLFTSAVLLLLRTTHPADLVYALTQRGLPHSTGYILLVSLQIFPEMVARATAILEAQRSRGLDTQGWRRVLALLPLTGPLVVGALADVEERAMALESRAYMVRGPKTSLRQLHDTAAQRWVRLLMIVAIVALIVWRLSLFVSTFL